MSGQGRPSPGSEGLGIHCNGVIRPMQQMVYAAATVAGALGGACGSFCEYQPPGAQTVRNILDHSQTPQVTVQNPPVAHQQHRVMDNFMAPPGAQQHTGFPPAQQVLQQKVILDQLLNTEKPVTGTGRAGEAVQMANY